MSASHQGTRPSPGASSGASSGATSDSFAPRALILGWDGATFDLLLPRVRAGVMPCLGRLLERAAWGPLLSTWPYMTAPAWTSIVTGKRPDTHGVLDWSIPQPGRLRRALVDSGWRADAAFWDILKARGKPAGTINLPLTWPPDTQATFCISDMFTPSLRSAFAHPQALKPVLLRLGYQLDLPREPFTHREDPSGGFRPYLRALIEVTRARGRAIRHILTTHPWTVAMAVFTEPDRLQHAFWEHLEPGSLSGDHAGREAKVRANAFYSALDAELGALLSLVGSETRIWMVSDHGFGPHKGAFYINEWLQREGFLTLQPETALERLGRRALLQGARMLRTQTEQRGSRLREPAWQLEATLEHQGHSLTPDSPPVCWEKTLAFADTAHGIRLNLAGRERFGIVAEGDVKALKQRLMDGLLRCTDPRTGAALHAQVLPREAVYGGRNTDLAPDLVYRLADCGYSWRIGALGALRFGRPLWDACLAVETRWETGTHRPEGIFVAAGPEIQPGPVTTPVHCWDVLPSLLYQLDEGIPPDLEGRVVRELFRPALLADRPQRWGGARALRGAPSTLRSDDAQTSPMAARLRALGYLG